MTKHNAQNERTKRKYMEFLKEASQYSETTMDACAKALHRFEVYTKFRDFKAFHIQQAVGFKITSPIRRMPDRVRRSARRPCMRP